MWAASCTISGRLRRLQRLRKSREQLGNFTSEKTMIQKGNFKAHLELHSVNPSGYEAITFTHTHERSATHAEFMTHRVSRNASSSRAIPFEKMVAWIDADPAMPLHLGLNKKG